MSRPRPVAYDNAPPAVRAVYDDIIKTHGIAPAHIHNFWLYLGNDPATLKRTWEDFRQVMAPGALDTLTKELIYLAVSVANNCEYCTAAHRVAARQAGMSEAAFGELMAVVGMASETNRLVVGWRVPLDKSLA